MPPPAQKIPPAGEGSRAAHRVPCRTRPGGLGRRCWSRLFCQHPLRRPIIRDCTFWQIPVWFSHVFLQCAVCPRKDAAKDSPVRRLGSFFYVMFFHAPGCAVEIPGRAGRTPRGGQRGFASPPLPGSHGLRRGDRNLPACFLLDSFNAVLYNLFYKV